MTLNELLLAAQELLNQNPHLGNRKVIVGDRRQGRYDTLSGIKAAGFTFDLDDPSRVDTEVTVTRHPFAVSELLVKIEYG